MLSQKEINDFAYAAGCLTVFAAIGLIAVLIGFGFGIHWLWNHLSITFY